MNVKRKSTYIKGETITEYDSASYNNLKCQETSPRNSVINYKFLLDPKMTS